MHADFSQIGNLPPAPAQFVGREKDLANLKARLTRTIEKQNAGVIRLMGDVMKRTRLNILTSDGAMTRAKLAERANNLSEAVITKAERGRPIRVSTAVQIAKALGIRLEDITAPSGESITLQTLVAVRGFPGMGKTTLAAIVAHDQQMRQVFEAGLWVSLGQSADTLAELNAWGRALGVFPVPEKDKSTARARLTAFLRDRRLLIIVDDAWTAEDAFDLMVGGPSCATLVTTRITEVADQVAPTEEDNIVLDGLSLDDAVKLLEELATSVVARHRDQARGLAADLERLPLALQVAGRLLRAEERKGLGVAQLLTELRDDATKLLDKSAPGDIPGSLKVGALLRKSTDVLDDRAQQCFAYLAPCPIKPARFDQKLLNALWRGIAENPVEMRDLFISRGLLEPVGDGRFWLHALLLAHAQRLHAMRTTKRNGGRASPESETGIT